MRELETRILQDVLSYLEPYIAKFHRFDAPHLGNSLEFSGKVNENDIAKTTVINVNIDHESQQVFITNIFMPPTMTRKNIGKTLISVIYSAAKTYRYSLILWDVVPGFYRRMLNRKAVPIEGGDHLLITHNTDFSPRTDFGSPNNGDNGVDFLGELRKLWGEHE